VFRSPAFIKSVTLATGRPYAERSERPPGFHDSAAEFLLANMVRPVGRRLRDPAHQLHGIVRSAERHDRMLRTLNDADLAARVLAMRGRQRRQGLDREHLGEIFSINSDAAPQTHWKNTKQ
jgi:preprotein translocase subunit SecA